ncbi:MAG: Rrf2 family transcriptional regulator [Verrucomicrobiales bacterium]|nr:Rrf2 family transcriptional regulator [Verrucomicrobiales bacterium]
MELSRFTDYSLRTLLYAGLHPDRILTVPEVAVAYGISENHLVKITHKLGKLGYLETRRGRAGGFRLSREPSSINLGEVVRATESLALVECLGSDGGRCPIVRACALKRVIAEARDAFLETFDRYTLQDMLRPREALLKSFV